MFSLEWSERAFDQMQSIISHYPGAQEWIRAVLRLMTHLLERTPEELGESRDRGNRFWCVDPLALSFHVDVAQRTVKIHSIKEM